MDWTSVLVAAFTGLLSGAAGSVLAPWANWGVETRRLTRATRSGLLRDARLKLRDGSSHTFTTTEEYAQMRPLLDTKLVSQLESGRVAVVESGGRQSGDGFKNQLFDEFARVERLWRLI